MNKVSLFTYFWILHKDENDDYQHLIGISEK